MATTLRIVEATFRRRLARRASAAEDDAPIAGRATASVSSGRRHRLADRRASWIRRASTRRRAGHLPHGAPTVAECCAVSRVGDALRGRTPPVEVPQRVRRPTASRAHPRVPLRDRLADRPLGLERRRRCRCGGTCLSLIFSRSPRALSGSQLAASSSAIARSRATCGMMRAVLSDQLDQLAGADVQRGAAQDMNGAPLPSRAVRKAFVTSATCRISSRSTGGWLARSVARSVLIAGARQMQPLERESVERDDDARA